MPDSPKAILERLNKMLNTWEQLAPTKIFGGMTLEQFRTIVNRCIAARDLLADLAAQTTAATTERENADDAGLVAAKMMANGVRADPAFGEDSALYEGIGYTRFSDRKSGLHRTKGSKKDGGGTGDGGTGGSGSGGGGTPSA
jgi:uncharacterized membrane protein YgcG